MTGALVPEDHTSTFETDRWIVTEKWGEQTLYVGPDEVTALELAALWRSAGRDVVVSLIAANPLGRRTR